MEIVQSNQFYPQTDKKKLIIPQSKKFRLLNLLISQANYQSASSTQFINTYKYMENVLSLVLFKRKKQKKQYTDSDHLNHSRPDFET